MLSVLIRSSQGPEFVRKHIFNKHAEKIEEVKKEVAFFNNFLTDAKRPALPEIKPAQPPGPEAWSSFLCIVHSPPVSSGTGVGSVPSPPSTVKQTQTHDAHWL